MLPLRFSFQCSDQVMPIKTHFYTEALQQQGKSGENSQLPSFQLRLNTVLQLQGSKRKDDFWGEVWETPFSNSSHQLRSQDAGELAVHCIGKSCLCSRAIRGLKPLLDFIQEVEGSGSFEVLQGRKKTTSRAVPRNNKVHGQVEKL